MADTALTALPGNILTYANQCANSPIREVQAAYLTGIVVGIGQGYEVYGYRKDAFAELMAKDFVKCMGKPPRDIPGYDYPQQYQPTPAPADDTSTGKHLATQALAAWEPYQQKEYQHAA